MSFDSFKEAKTSINKKIIELKINNTLNTTNSSNCLPILIALSCNFFRYG